MRTSVAGPINEGTTKGSGGGSLLALLALAIIIRANDNVDAEHTFSF